MASPNIGTKLLVPVPTPKYGRVDKLTPKQTVVLGIAKVRLGGLFPLPGNLAISKQPRVDDISGKSPFEV
jgi:hypothetical protein